MDHDGFAPMERLIAEYIEKTKVELKDLNDMQNILYKVTNS